MENTIEKRHINVKDVNYDLILTTFSKIKAFVKENDYRFKDEKGFNEITKENFDKAYNDLSKKKRKKLASFIWTVNNHPSFSNVNKFLHFFMKHFMNSDTRIRVIKSEKEIAIQEKRKQYKEALAKAKAAYGAYKLEKGDFYKIRLSKKQEIQ